MDGARADVLLRCIRMMYTAPVKRTQIYLTERQHAEIARQAADLGVSKAEVIRRVLDEALGIDDGAAARVAAIDASAGVLADAPDWPEWLAAVRGAPMETRLEDLGL